MKEKQNIISKTIEKDKDIDPIVKRVVRRFIGNSAYIGEKLERDQFRIYQLGITSMDYVRDLEEDETTTWFEDFENVSKIKVDMDSNGEDKTRVKIHIPDRSEVQKEFIDKKKIHAMKTEKKLMEIIYSKISEIPEVRLSFNAIIEILNYLCEYEEIKRRSVRAYRDDKQADRYLMFLKTYDYIEEDRERDLFYPGKELRELQKIPNGGLKKENEVKVIKDLLKRGYSYIVDELNLKHVIPYSRISNSYYLSAVESNKILKMDESYLRDRMMNIYEHSRRKNKMKTLKHLKDLNEVGVLEKERDKVYGQDKVFEDFSEKLSDEMLVA